MSAVCELSKQINAPPEKVFAAMADLANAPSRIPAIVKVEMLTPGPVGVGTKFKETRKMFGRECTEAMEVTGYDPNQRIEIGGCSCGTEFRTEFRFTPESGGTRVDLAMNCIPKTFFAKVVGPMTGWMMKGAMRKCVEEDLASIAKHVESE